MTTSNTSKATLREIASRITPRVAWDWFMVNLALLNLALILFHFTFLLLRPFYLDHAPRLVELYDPVLGISEDESTARYLELVDELRGASSLAAATPTLDQLRGRVDDARLFRAFSITGQIPTLRTIEARATRLALDRDAGEVRSLGAAFDVLWSPSDLDELHASVDDFDRELKPLLERLYDREFGRSGQPADYGWLVDLPFLIIFSIEFYGRWFVAIRRRTYPKWFIFPILNWYDLLGIVPLPQFRFFRLFRVVSIYIRLSRSDRSLVGDDVFSRAGRAVANIISEEVSDMVSMRILNETQEELRAGRHREIIRTVLPAHRVEIGTEVAEQVRKALTDPTLRTHARQFLDVNLERAVSASESLRSVPLPNFVLEPLVAGVGRVVFDATIETLADTLDSREGRALLAAIVADAVDAVVDDLTSGDVETLITEITLDIIEHVKSAVAVKKWTLPDPEEDDDDG